METQKKQIIRLLLAAVLFNYAVLGAFMLIPTLQEFLHPARYIRSSENTIEVSISYEENGEAGEEVLTLARGTEVRLRKTGEKESEVEYNGTTFYVDNDVLADSLEEAIDIDYVYPRRLVNLRTDRSGKLSDVTASQGEALEVISVRSDDLNPETGVISWYQVEKDGREYWISGAAVETSEEASMTNYASSLTYSTYWDDYYGSGYSADAYVNQPDYKPIEKTEYEDNPLPTDLNAVHVSLENLLYYHDFYLNLKEETGINALVVELKDDYGNVLYESDVLDDYLDNPDAAQAYTRCDLEYLQELFQEFQDAGYYMIGRIVTFKDPIYASQNPENAITIAGTDDPAVYNEMYWPSVYSRDVWEYNVAIAKEIAPLVNEVQFDYVRFPDGTLEDNLSGEIDFHNTYNESKTAALQSFLLYAREELEPFEVYLAADVFAWPAVAKDDQDMGQYLPAIANVVDVISPMAYPDHFSEGAMGVENPGSQPGDTLYEFTTIMKATLEKLSNPPVLRTWIAGYSPYDAADVEEQIDGLNAAGAEGYMVWTVYGDYNSVYPLIDGMRDSALQTYSALKSQERTYEPGSDVSEETEDASSVTQEETEVTDTEEEEPEDSQ